MNIGMVEFEFTSHIRQSHYGEYMVEHVGKGRAYDNTGSLNVVARARMIDVQLNAFKQYEQKPVLDLMYTRPDIVPYFGPLLLPDGTVKPRILSKSRHAYSHSDLLIIDTLEVLPAFRRRGYSAVLMFIMLNRIGRLDQLIALRTIPLQALNITRPWEDSYWRRNMRLKEFDKPLWYSKQKLKSYFEEIGMVDIGVEDMMVAGYEALTQQTHREIKEISRSGVLACDFET